MRQWIVTKRIAALGRRPEFWLTGLMVWLAASACLSLGTPWAGAALEELLRWGVGIGLALALSQRLHRTGGAARLLTLAAGALALCGIWDGLRPDRGGLTGPYLDHQLYGSALLVLLPFTAALALTERDYRWRLGAQAAGAAGVVCLILSQSRCAWAGLLAATLVFGWLWCRYSRPQWRQFTAPAVCAAALFAGGLCVWTVTAPPEVRAPLASRSSTLAHLGSDSSWQTRLVTWRGAARMLDAHPLTGFGLGRYPGIQAAWTHQGRLLTPETRPSLSEEAHNFTLQTAAEIGIIGLALYGAVLITFIVLGRRRLQRSGPHSHRRPFLVIAALSMVAGQSVDALASPSYQFTEVSLLFWAALGVGLSALRHANAEPLSVGIPLPLHRLGQTALAGSIAVLLAAQILPLGLLSPVEAYTAPAGWTFLSDKTTILGTAATASVGDKITYTLTASYQEAGGTIHNVNVSADSTAKYFATMPQTGATSYGTFVVNPAAQNVSYTVPGNTSGRTLTIFGTFKSGSLTGNATTTLVIR